MSLRPNSSASNTTRTSAAYPVHYKALQSILSSPISPSTLRALSILFPTILRTS